MRYDGGERARSMLSITAGTIDPSTINSIMTRLLHKKLHHFRSRTVLLSGSQVLRSSELAKSFLIGSTLMRCDGGSRARSMLSITAGTTDPSARV